MVRTTTTQLHAPPRMGYREDRSSGNKNRWVKQRTEVGSIGGNRDEGSGAGEGIKDPGIKW